jgi:hypothetical protein
MAWRIHDHVIRGEVDNRIRGKISGRLWLEGTAEPMVIELEGNAAPDLAGCLLTFENTEPAVPVRSDARLAPLQRGNIGDLTASRKVRVFDLPMPEVWKRFEQKLPVPEHMANCLYLEWYSEANGRVVVESTGYRLTISPPAWRLTPEEERHRQEQSAAGFTGFLETLTRAIEARKHEPPEDKAWDEFDYEKFMRESDARCDKYGELLDKYENHPDRDQIIEREMGWTFAGEEEEAQGPESTEPAELSRGAASSNEPAPDLDFDEADDELAAAEPDPMREGIDWVRDEHGMIQHPLCVRTREGSVALWRKCKELGIDYSADYDLRELVEEYQITGAKLAGALGAFARGDGLPDGAFIVACLKRALSHLHRAQAALERVFPKRLLAADVLPPVRAELFAVREETLRLMQKFRELP